MADDRYQSAAGLEADVKECFSQWQARGRIEPFALGTRDVSDQFVVPQKLYGREKEVAALVQAFERVAQTGAPATVLISGYSGIGKTTLVQELYRPTVRRGLLHLRQARPIQARHTLCDHLAGVRQPGAATAGRER